MTADPKRLTAAAHRIPPSRRRRAAALATGLGLSLACAVAAAQQPGSPVPTAMPASKAAASSARTECRVEDIKKEMAKSQPFFAKLQSVFSENCGTYKNLLRRLVAPKTNAGRKLEPTRELDRAAAQAELAKAHADPAFQRELAAETDGITDPLTRKLLEAALLHENDYLKARDLLMQELQQQVGEGS